MRATADIRFKEQHALSCRGKRLLKLRTQYYWREKKYCCKLLTSKRHEHAPFACGKCIFACLQATCIASLAKLSHGLVQSSSGILNRSFPPRSGVRKRRTVAVSLADGGARFGLETDSASQFPVLVDCTSQSDGST